MRFSTTDIAVTGAATLAVAGLLWLFAADIMQVSRRENARALGTVEFKRLNATRRAVDALSWERMRNHSPVWEQDTLRTADLSAATVTFTDMTKLEIQENSMLRLNFSRDIKTLEFLSGEITLGGKARSNWAISTGAGSLSLGENTRASIRRTADDVNVEVEEGEATLVRADGSTVQVALNEELAVNVKTGAARLVARPLVPLSPTRNARLLWLDAPPSVAAPKAAPPSVAASTSLTATGTVDVGFSWRVSSPGGAAGDPSPVYSLELSGVPSFDDEVFSHSVSGIQAIVPVAPGTWFWRLVDSDGSVSPARRFTLERDEESVLLAPQDGARYRYRRIAPSIRFSWTPLEAANSWLFELSASADFASPSVRTRVMATSLNVPALEEGSWYWRVSPVHDWALLSPSNAGETRSLEVVRSGEMAAVELASPFEGTLFQVQELDTRGLAFAWNPVDEAISYELAFARDKALSNPALVLPAALSWLRLKSEDAALLASPGTWYWAVRWVDAEGNRSPFAAARRLEGVDGSIAIRPSFPPEGYRIADSLAANTRFTWKSNIAARTVFQVAGSEDFAELLHEETVKTETTFARKWPAGRYWWRLRTYNSDGSVFIDTARRSFTIVEPLPPPVLDRPASGALFYLREGDLRSFGWSPVPLADYYSVAIYGPHDNYAKPIYERGIVSDTAIDFDMGNWPSGDYRLSVQAHALESPDATRIIGYIGGGILRYEKLQYLQLEYPAADASLEGLPSRRRGVAFSVLMSPPPDSGELLISADPSHRTPLYRIPLAAASVRSGRLDPGTWYWRVNGTKAGFDLSSRESRRFVVSPIPPLPASTLVAPLSDAVIDAAYLRQRRDIDFAWEAVPNATGYVLSIHRDRVQNPPLARFELDGQTGFTLEDLALLDRGTFVWTLEARSYDRNGEIEQHGLLAERRFTIDLPPARDQNASGKGTLYGR